MALAAEVLVAAVPAVVGKISTEWIRKMPAKFTFAGIFCIELFIFYLMSRKMVCSRFGPTEAMVTGIPISSSIKLI